MSVVGRTSFQLYDDNSHDIDEEEQVKDYGGGHWDLVYYLEPRVFDPAPETEKNETIKSRALERRNKPKQLKVPQERINHTHPIRD